MTTPTAKPAKVPPRHTPTRDEKYMGLAWIHAAFSKDPNTQVGSVIVSDANDPLGSGYNGPPGQVPDYEMSWERAPKDDPDAYSKNDIIVHAEANAIDHSCGDLQNATIYVTAMPCNDCMKEIVRKGIARVVYMDYQSDKNSTLASPAHRAKSVETARRGKVTLVKFNGNLNWLPDWMAAMKGKGVFGDG
jgi:dCMP deaminase